MKVVAYVRKSTSGTDENGVERQEGSYLRQRAAIEDYAKRRGMEIIGWYEEPVSGKSIRKRKVFLQMVRDAKAPGRLFKAIVFGEYDRFMRDVKEAMRHEVELDDAGVEIHFTNLKNDGSMGDQIYKSVAREMAAEYSRELARKVVQGMVQKAKKGSWLGGTAPYGYGTEKDPSTNIIRLVINEKEAKIVQEIFELSRKGNGHKWIAIFLNKRGIPAGIVARNRASSNRNPDGKWSGSTIRMMLRNPVYKGVFRWNKRERVDCFDWKLQDRGTIELGKLRTQLDRFKNNGALFIDREKPTGEWITQEKGVPAIVSAEIFDEVQKRFLPYSSRKWLRPNTIKYLMSGTLRCSCGNNFFGHRQCRKGDKSKHWEYYRCSGELNKGSHGDTVRRSIPCRFIDEVALRGITGRLEGLLDQSKVETMLKARMEGFISSRPGRLAEVENELKQTEREMARLIESYVKFEMPLPEEKVSELNGRKRALEKELETLVQAGDCIGSFDVNREVSNAMKIVKRARERIDSADSTARIGIRDMFLRGAAVSWATDMPRIDFKWRKYPMFTGEKIGSTSTTIIGSIPDLGVTVRTGDIGYTISGTNGYSNGSKFLLSSSKYPRS